MLTDTPAHTQHHETFKYGGLMLGQGCRRWPNIKPPLVVMIGLYTVEDKIVHHMK